jgi:hypothetical protein
MTRKDIYGTLALVRWLIFWNRMTEEFLCDDSDA